MQLFPFIKDTLVSKSHELIDSAIRVISGEREEAFEDLFKSFIEEGREKYTGIPAGFAFIEEPGTHVSFEKREFFKDFMRKRNAHEVSLQALDELAASGAPMSMARVFSVLGGDRRSAEPMSEEMQEHFSLFMRKLGFSKEDTDTLLDFSDAGNNSDLWQRVEQKISALPQGESLHIPVKEFASLLDGLDISPAARKQMLDVFRQSASEDFTPDQLRILLGEASKELALKQNATKIMRQHMHKAMDEANKNAQFAALSAPNGDIRTDRRAFNMESRVKSHIDAAVSSALDDSNVDEPVADVRQSVVDLARSKDKGTEPSQTTTEKKARSHGSPAPEAARSSVHMGQDALRRRLSEVVAELDSRQVDQPFRQQLSKITGNQGMGPARENFGDIRPTVNTAESLPKNMDVAESVSQPVTAGSVAKNAAVAEPLSKKDDSPVKSTLFAEAKEQPAKATVGKQYASPLTGEGSHEHEAGFADSQDADQFVPKKKDLLAEGAVQNNATFSSGQAEAKASSAARMAEEVQQAIFQAAAPSTGFSPSTSGAQSHSAAPRMDSAFFSQIQNGTYLHAADGGKQLSVQLQPTDLGQLTLILHVKEGELRALIKADSAEAAALVNDQLASIKQTLEDGGLKVAELEVQTQLREDSSFNHWQGSQEHNAMHDAREWERVQRLQQLRQADAAERKLPVGQKLIQPQMASAGLHIVA